MTTPTTPVSRDDAGLVAAAALSTEEAFERLMDDLQVLYRLRAGDTVSQDDVDALNRLESHWRENDEQATNAYNRGWSDGLSWAGGTDLASAQAKLDDARGDVAVQRAMRKFDERLGFQNGAAACREVMARFVEQGGHTAIANSIRLNWSAEWGDEPTNHDATQAKAPGGDA